MSRIREFLKTVAFRHFPSISAPRYPYMLDPVQLAFLVDAISERANTGGCIVEVGAARGMTTRFLTEHLVRENIRKEYHVVDTFSSFTGEDLEYETAKRGKSRARLARFTYNDCGRWKENFSPFGFIHAHECDCKLFDFGTLKPVSVALLDVDLYLPTLKALPGIYAALEPGGVILVDDVKAGGMFDGAHQAYVEFCRSRGIREEILGQRGGIIRCA